MRTVRLLLALLAAVLLLALPAAALAQAANITGTINLRQRSTLPSNAVVTIQLADVSRAGAPATVIAQQQFTTNGAQAPFSFTLPYNLSQIAQNGVYSVQGNIKVNGQLRYTTDTQYRVITGGRPTSVNITMAAVRLPTTSGGTWLLGVAALLMALVLGIRLLRHRLVAALAA